jgi:hypothetical protein
LVQRNNENVNDYYLWVSDAFKKMCEAKPAAIATVRAERGAATAEQAAAIKLEGVKDSEGFFKHQLFIAGLKEDIRMKIMEAGKPSIQESVAHARELEVIHEDRKKGSTVGTSPKTTTTTTWTTKNAPQLTPSVCKEADLHSVVQVNPQVRIYSLVRPILAKANNSNRFSVTAGIAKSKVTIKRTAENKRQPRPQWSTVTANRTPTNSLQWLRLNNRTTTPELPPSRRSRRIPII